MSPAEDISEVAATLSSSTLLIFGCDTAATGMTCVDTDRPMGDIVARYGRVPSIGIGSNTVVRDRDPTEVARTTLALCTIGRSESALIS